MADIGIFESCVANFFYEINFDKKGRVGNTDSATVFFIYILFFSLTIFVS